MIKTFTKFLYIKEDKFLNIKFSLFFIFIIFFMFFNKLKYIKKKILIFYKIFTNDSKFFYFHYFWLIFNSFEHFPIYYLFMFK